MTCPPCTHDCNEGRNCPLIAINAQVVGYVAPQRTWVGLDHHDKKEFSSWLDHKTDDEVFTAIEAKLKEKNT